MFASCFRLHAFVAALDQDWRELDDADVGLRRGKETEDAAGAVVVEACAAAASAPFGKMTRDPLAGGIAVETAGREIEAGNAAVAGRGRNAALAEEGRGLGSGALLAGIEEADTGFAATVPAAEDAG